MIHLFSDASGSPQLNIAVGAFIFLDDVALKNIDNSELMRKRSEKHIFLTP
jgi:hypothetical protein